MFASRRMLIHIELHCPYCLIAGKQFQKQRQPLFTPPYKDRLHSLIRRKAEKYSKVLLVLYQGFLFSGQRRYEELISIMHGIKVCHHSKNTKNLWKNISQMLGDVISQNRTILGSCLIFVLFLLFETALNNYKKSHWLFDSVLIFKANKLPLTS